jgi:replicative DNA helicase
LGINLGHFGTGAISDDDASRLARQAGMSADSPLWVDDTPSHTLGSIQATARKWKQRHGLRLLVVDYLQLITPPKAENRQVAVSELSRGLKLLAAQLDLPIMVAAQLNRGPENRTSKVPALSDLRESGSLESDASVVILVHREAASDPKSLRQGEADLIVAKNRNGAQATVQVAAQLHYARFASMAGHDQNGHHS